MYNKTVLPVIIQSISLAVRRIVCNLCNYYVYFLSSDYHNDDDNSVIGYIIAGLLAFILTSVLVIGIIVAVIIRKKKFVNQSPQTALATPPQTSEVQYMHHSDPSQAEVIMQSCPNSAQQQTSQVPISKEAICKSANVESTNNSSISYDDDKPASNGKCTPDGSTNNQSNSYSNTFTT